MDYKLIENHLKYYLTHPQGIIDVLAGKDKLIIQYRPLGKEFSNKGRRKEVNFSVGKTGKMIYIFGSSTVASKPPLGGNNFLLFPEMMKKELSKSQGSGIEVYNLAVTSFDSFDIDQLIRSAVNIKRPDLIIFYDCSGSDFGNAFAACIQNEFNFVRGPAKRIFETNKITRWLLKSFIEPNLLDSARRLGLVKLNQKYFSSYNEDILKSYQKNINSLINFTRQEKIPLIIVGSVSNLEARPLGADDSAEKYYNLGMSQKNYQDRISYLKLAKDYDVFTSDVGGPMIKINKLLDSLQQEGVYVLDLQQELENDNFSFGYNYFYDIGHMKQGLHEIISGQLVKFINEKKLLN